MNMRNDPLCVPGEPTSLEPRKRPRRTLQSTLVMKDGQPYRVAGSPGGDDQIMRTDADAVERDRVRHERAAGDPALLLSGPDNSGNSVEKARGTVLQRHYTEQLWFTREGRLLSPLAKAHDVLV